MNKTVCIDNEKVGEWEKITTLEVFKFSMVINYKVLTRNGMTRLYWIIHKGVKGWNNIHLYVFQKNLAKHAQKVKAYCSTYRHLPCTLFEVGFSSSSQFPLIRLDKPTNRKGQYLWTLASLVATLNTRIVAQTMSSACIKLGCRRDIIFTQHCWTRVWIFGTTVLD